MELFFKKSLDALRVESEKSPLRRSLGRLNLIALGIGSIIGTGIFVMTGTAASQNAGPALVLSMLISAAGCAFAGLCYAEFAAMVPVAGSAYTYAYATVGELFAWIIGWDLILEYALSTATVAVGWSGYFVSFTNQIGIHIPLALTGPLGRTIVGPNGEIVNAIFNLPAAGIVGFVAWLLIIGIRQSANTNTVLVLIKSMVLAVFIVAAYSYVKKDNLTPFIPPNTGEFGHFGWSGVMRAAGVIFFAYIGFDAVSTAAQETKNPQRDMPIGIIGSLLICTVLYVAFSYVLTGIVNYKTMTDTAIYEALDAIGYHWLGTGVVIGILAGYTSVIRVMLLGQSRVFYSMSRDGLLPKMFSDVHTKYQTPWRSNLLFMVFVSLFSGLVPLSSLGNMTSIGTLLAFVIVCGGVMIMRRTHPDLPRPYRTPLVPLVPIMGIVVCFALMASLDMWTWIRLVVWLAIGLTVYFTYSRYHSHLVTDPESKH